MVANDTGLVPSLKETLLDPSIEGMSDAILEIGEVGLDGILQDELLKDIPILGTIAALCKTGANLRERNLIRQTAKFLTSYNKGTIERDKLEAHRKMLENEPDKAERELGRVLLLLDRTIEGRKAEVVGAFYRHFVNGAFHWPTFVELSEVNERMFVDDYVLLRQLFRKTAETEGQSNKTTYRYQRLESLGLVYDRDTRVENETLVFVTDVSRYELSPLGRRFASSMD